MATSRLRRVSRALQERFDFTAKIAIAGAGLGEECGTICGRAFERGVIDRLDPGPGFGLHVRFQLYQQ